MPYFAANENLTFAIENLYATFGRYPLRMRVEGCPCCISNTDKEALHRKNLDELEAEDLRKYTFKAISTWGDVNDFKHFLPRIFELMTMDSEAIDGTVALNKLIYANWKSWPKVEIEKITAFLTVWWKAIVQTDNDLLSQHFHDLYPLIGVRTLIDNWWIDPMNDTFRNFVHFIKDDAMDLTHLKGRFKNMDKKDAEQIEQWLVDWLPELEAGFDFYYQQDPEFVKQIAESYDILVCINNQRPYNKQY